MASDKLNGRRGNTDTICCLCNLNTPNHLCICDPNSYPKYNPAANNSGNKGSNTDTNYRIPPITPYCSGGISNCCICSNQEKISMFGDTIVYFRLSVIGIVIGLVGITCIGLSYGITDANKLYIETAGKCLTIIGIALFYIFISFIPSPSFIQRRI